MDVWRCISIAKDDLKTTIYTLERITGELHGETKTIEGPEGQFRVGQFYDDDLNPIPNWDAP